jgi:hypothetical protein
LYSLISTLEKFSFPDMFLFMKPFTLITKIHLPLLHTGITTLPVSHLLTLLYKIPVIHYTSLQLLMTFYPPHLPPPLDSPPPPTSPRRSSRVRTAPPHLQDHVCNNLHSFTYPSSHYINYNNIYISANHASLFPPYKILSNLLHMLRQVNMVVGNKLCKLSCWHLRKLVLGIL